MKKIIEDEVFIENTCLGIGSKNAGRNSNADVVLNTDHVVLLANGLSASAIYILGTSGIPPILNFRSVSPINV